MLLNTPCEGAHAGAPPNFNFVSGAINSDASDTRHVLPPPFALHMATAPQAVLFPGSIKFFHQTKGYGFIVPDDNSGDVFFHFKSLNNPGASPSSPLAAHALLLFRSLHRARA